MTIEKLKVELEQRMERLDELYNFYLDKLDKVPYDISSLERLNSIRIEMFAFRSVLRMIGGIDE